MPPKKAGVEACEFTEEGVRAERPSAMAEKVVKTALLLTFETNPALADYSDLALEAYRMFKKQGRTRDARRRITEHVATALAKRANINRSGHRKSRNANSDSDDD